MSAIPGKASLSLLIGYEKTGVSDLQHDGSPPGSGSSTSEPVKKNGDFGWIWLDLVGFGWIWLDLVGSGLIGLRGAPEGFVERLYIAVRFELELSGKHGFLPLRAIGEGG